MLAHFIQVNSQELELQPLIIIPIGFGVQLSIINLISKRAFCLFCNKRFATGSSDKSIRLYDLPSRISVKAFNEHEDTIRSLTYLENSDYLVSGSYDSMIKI